MSYQEPRTKRSEIRAQRTERVEDRVSDTDTQAGEKSRKCEEPKANQPTQSASQPAQLHSYPYEDPRIKQPHAEGGLQGQRKEETDKRKGAGDVVRERAGV